MAYKRKYRKGAKILSLDELAKQEFIYFYDKITHSGWFMSWQFSLAAQYIQRGCLYYAEKVSGHIVFDNTCVCCGETIPEGRQICPTCEDVTDKNLKSNNFEFKSNKE
jgi:hypothetical protein